MTCALEKTRLTGLMAIWLTSLPPLPQPPRPGVTEDVKENLNVSYSLNATDSLNG